ncbi:MAG: fumarate hydratase C-terminal domain-containing protein [Thermodesulfobacteriaceae bacterium]|nr:fumarate hydratase C-terminal domain-containing protein [Caldimicrobium sp.]MCX8041238.1 fumarate hydratase C-terminal domain-containing protein [Thermodesulfobacteriaceae bacterium]MDW8135488.1 fumarate hydratase C-terminal domain-containing protein [Thermodesulfobacterium sp.]
MGASFKSFLEVFKRAKKLEFPLEKREFLKELKEGDPVLISGWLLCGRDATHQRILSSIERGCFDFDFTNQAMYYVGPTPSPPQKIIGSVGPTTASRMDYYMEFLLKKGLCATLGKGKRSKKVIELLKEYQAIYLATFGGAGAFLSQFVEKVEPIAWEELGAEAFFRIKVSGFPAIVINSIYGGDFYEKIRK